MSAHYCTTIPLALVLAFSACAMPGMQLTEQDRADIAAVGDSYLQAAVDGDWDAYAAVFAEEGAELPPGGEMRRGRSTIRAGADYITVDFTGFRTANATIGGEAGLAYRWMDYDLTSVAPERAEPFTYRGKLLTIMQRQSDGSWEVVVAMWNARPAPAGP